MTSRDVAIREQELAHLASILADELLAEHGPLMGGRDLWLALGLPSGMALRAAIARGTVPVAIFPIEHRRGRFALTKDVANWLARQRLYAPSKGVVGREVT